MDQITYRTNDNTRWGQGNGSDLTATQIDINFWVLFTAIEALQDHSATSAGIESIIVNGNQMTVMLTNHLALGPFTLPTAAFNFRGAWQANQSYNVNDVVTQGGAVYLVIFPIANSGSSFNPFQNDGNGHNWWATLLAAPPSELPATGNPGAFLQMTELDSPGSAQWINFTRIFGLYLETKRNPLEEVWRYVVPEMMVIPQGAPNCRANAGTSPTTDQSYEIYWNGANVGSINFTPSPDTPSFTFPHTIVFEPGDIITVVAPSVPDPHMTLIAITLVASLTQIASPL